MITVLASVRAPVPWSILKEAKGLQAEINRQYSADVLAKNVRHLVFNIVSRHGNSSDLEDSISISRRTELWSTVSVPFERFMDPASQRDALKQAVKLAMNALPPTYVSQSEQARFSSMMDSLK